MLNNGKEDAITDEGFCSKVKYDILGCVLTRNLVMLFYLFFCPSLDSPPRTISGPQLLLKHLMIAGKDISYLSVEYDALQAYDSNSRQLCIDCVNSSLIDCVDKVYYLANIQYNSKYDSMPQ
jgi:hypothetical protein